MGGGSGQAWPVECADFHTSYVRWPMIGLQTQVKKSRQAGGYSVSAAAANERNFTGETVTVPRGGRLYCVLFAGLYWNTAAGH